MPMRFCCFDAGKAGIQVDKQGRLSENDLKVLTGAISERLTASCWNCGCSDWLIFPTLLGEGFYDKGGLYMTSATLGPKVRLTCKNCGNIIYFSADALGFTGAEDE